MLDQEELKKLVHYDQETGIMLWKSREETCFQLKAWNIKHAGKRVGVEDTRGHLRTKLRGYKRTYSIHRLAWLYVYGSFPEGQLDHINRIKTDNRIDNLRISDDTLNQHNIEMWSNNTSGVKGVHWDKSNKKWMVKIRWRGERLYLGSFENLEDAKEAYATASIQYAKNFSIHSENRIG